MNFSIWTPRYVVNRTRLFFYEKLHKNEPWIPSKAVKAIDKALHKNMKGIEFGSGRSTVWYASRINHLVSVEDHKEWFKQVQGELEKSSVSNVKYVYKSSDEGVTGHSEYGDFINNFENESIDFIVVDGKYRDRIANDAIQKLSAGGILLLDDSERYLAYASKAPYSIGNKDRAMTDSWKKFSEAVSSWKKEVYTNGVTDTTLFIKP